MVMITSKETRLRNTAQSLSDLFYEGKEPRDLWIKSKEMLILIKRELNKNKKE